MEALDQDSLLRERLAYQCLKYWLLQNAPKTPLELPTWSVIICSRDRTEDLRRCLDSIMRVDVSVLPTGEIVVVDNAPSSPQTAQLAAGYPVKYLREDRPGLNWARARGAREAAGEIVIYTDDDVIVDGGWIKAMLEPFESSRTAAVTGLILPLELEAEPQELFERYGGFGRGFEKRAFDYTNIAPSAAGYVGAGASMALRRELVVDLGLFEAELDCGTAAETGGDAYAFYRLLANGYRIVYNPEALIWHRHRRDYTSLRKTLASYSVGGFAFLTRCLVQHRDLQAIGVALSWLWSDHLEQLARVLSRSPDALPLDLVLAQFTGVPRGIIAYFISRRREREYLKSHFQLPASVVPLPGPDMKQEEMGRMERKQES
jgi:GT2 family glycosyltransferase